MADKPEKPARQRIDDQLARAGWGQGTVKYVEEFLIPGEELRDRSIRFAASNEFADYVLLDGLHIPLAVVEAKRTSRSPLEGERQAADYADRIKATHGVDPFIFLANGKEILFWHRSLYAPRKVSGFYTRNDLERLAFLNRFREPLAGAAALTSPKPPSNGITNSASSPLTQSSSSAVANTLTISGPRPAPNWTRFSWLPGNYKSRKPAPKAQARSPTPSAP